MTTYSAGRAGLALADRRAMLTQDVMRLERERLTAPARSGRHTAAASSYYADIHDRTNLLNWIRGFIETWDKLGDVAMDAWCREGRTSLSLPEYLERMEDEIAAFKAGGGKARLEHCRARTAAGAVPR